MSTALYNKWRPQKWEEVVGQQHIIQTLRNAVAGDHLVQAYLFAGPRGTGKTTAARLLAKAVNCLDPDPAARPCNQCAHCVAVNEGRFLDLIEIDAASQTGVDDVRDLRDKINFSPNQGKYKVYIIDEVHMFSTSAFNALLKTLEEPPPHAIFILATTEMHKIPATVLSRCQRHEFRRVSVDDITNQLKRIVETEKLNAEPEALRLIARQSNGGMRDAISLLDQMASTGKEITLELTQAVLGTATSQTVVALLQAVAEKQPAAGMDAIHQALDAGSDPRLLARQVVDYLRALLLIQMGNLAQVDLAADVRAQAEKHARAFSAGEVLRMIKAFNAAASEQRGGWQPSLPLELALAESLEKPVEVPAAAKPVKPEGQRSVLYQMANPPARKAAEKPIERPVEKPAPRKEEQKPEENAAPPTKPDVSLDQVVNAWKQIYVEIKKKEPGLAAWINTGKPIELKNNVLTIATNSEGNLARTDTPEHNEILRKTILDVLSVELGIKWVASNAKFPPNVKADGMVAAALKAGGEIVDTQE